MSDPIYLVDAFVQGPYTGNPAGVCILDHPISDEIMQLRAMEMNQAETAFVAPAGDSFSLRWFTPTVEVDLCGHATLASARVLLDKGYVKEQIRFQTKSGELTAMPKGDLIELDFPAEPPIGCNLPVELTFLTGRPTWTGKNRMDWFVVLDDEDAVRNLAPDFPNIAALKMRGLIVTAQAKQGSDFDFVSRCFFPQSGVSEDPVTGSAHCALACYWSEALGRAELRGYQASARGGLVETDLRGSRVRLRGRAVMTMEGRFLV